MISRPGRPARPVSSGPGLPLTKSSLRRSALILLAPVVVYAIVRPLVASDAVGLAVAGAIPILYSILLAIGRRRIDFLVLLTAVGFAVACLASLLAGGSSLPLKLHEAIVTFAIGIVLLIATLIRRPIPLGHLLHVPSPTKQIDGSLGAMIGGFLVLHALLHLTVAVSLSTSSYLVLSKVINWGTLAVGGLALSAYLRRAQATSTKTAR
jgi:hypothetical protein